MRNVFYILLFCLMSAFLSFGVEAMAQITTLHSGLPFDEVVDVAESPDGSTLYVLCQSDNVSYLYKLDLADPSGPPYDSVALFSESEIADVVNPTGLAISPDGNTIYIASSAQIYSVDLTNPNGPPYNLNAIYSVSSSYDWICGITISPDGTNLYFVGGASVPSGVWPSYVWRLPVTGGSADLLYENAPFAYLVDIAISPDGQTLYISDCGENVIYSLPANGGIPVVITSELPTSYVAGVGVSLDGDTLFVSGEGGVIVTLDLTNPAGPPYSPSIFYEGSPLSGPAGLAFSSDQTTLYVGDFYNSSVFSMPSGLEPFSPSSPPLTLDVSGDLEVSEGGTLFVQLNVNGANGYTITYTVENLPEGAVFDASDNTITWNTGYDDAGVYENIVLSAMDNGDPMRMDYKIVTFTVGNVNRPPVFGSLGPQSIAEGGTLSFVVTFSDPDGDNIDATADVANFPFGVECVEQSESIACSWTPEYSQSGTYLFGFFATDDGDPNLTSRFDVQISVNDVTATDLAKELNEIIFDPGVELDTDELNSYTANLKKVEGMIADGRFIPARQQIEAFKNKVTQDINSGSIASTDGENLIRIANDILALITVEN